MKLKISAGGAFVSHYLRIKGDGVKYAETSLWGSRWFRFDQIDCVLMAPNHVLSFQVGNEVFSIPSLPGNRSHEATIEALVAGTRQTTGSVALASTLEPEPAPEHCESPAWDKSAGTGAS